MNILALIASTVAVLTGLALFSLGFLLGSLKETSHD
jgi:hypothetical protein